MVAKKSTRARSIKRKRQSARIGDDAGLTAKEAIQSQKIFDAMQNILVGHDLSVAYRATLNMLACTLLQDCDDRKAIDSILDDVICDLRSVAQGNFDTVTQQRILHEAGLLRGTQIH